jgi:hypothetical protein
MFKNILIPISSEYFKKDVFKTGALLAKKFNSSINLVYIIEEKTLNQTDKLSDAYRTPQEKGETKKEIIRKYIQSADKIIFDEAKYYFKNKKIDINEAIIKGEFSTAIKSQLEKKQYDLILMGFEKECLLNYRLLDDVNVPIWIESGNKSESILAVCSNLAPNQKVPDLSIKLSKALDWNLNMLYIIDTQDSVEVDINGQRSGKKSMEILTEKGKKFIEDMEKKGLNVKLKMGSLEKETIKAAKDFGSKLVVIGREQKKKGLLGVSTKSIKRKMAEKCKYSLLFIN